MVITRATPRLHVDGLQAEEPFPRMNALTSSSNENGPLWGDTLPALPVIEVVYVTVLDETSVWDMTFAGIIPLGHEHLWWVTSEYDEDAGCDIYTLTRELAEG
jgi:hypothetical protein